MELQEALRRINTDSEDVAATGQKLGVDVRAGRVSLGALGYF